MTSVHAGSLQTLLRDLVKSIAGESVTVARVLAEHGLQEAA